ncbi:MAG: PEP-CTERM sorting domain-containing protein [Burkholderiaceae bacterium]
MSTPCKPLRRAVTAASVLLAVAGLPFAPGTAGAAELQAYAGAVAGVAQGSGSPFACATSGPTIGNGWFAGISLPTEGFAACHLAGGIDNQFASGGVLHAAQSATGTVEGGSFSGSSSAVAGFGRLGVAAEGLMTGGTSAFTYHQAAGFARFQDTLTLSNPLIATGTAGSVNFGFLIDGLLSSSPHPPYTQQADIALGLRVGGGSGGPWTSFQATVINDGLPYVRGGSTGLPGSFVLGAGSLSGSADVLSTANFGFQWGVPFQLEVAFLTSVYPCCWGAAMAADFSSTAVMSAIVARANGLAVSDFTVASQSGTAYGAAGLLPVPEPASAWLLGAGALALWAWRRLGGGRGPMDSIGAMRPRSS